MIEKIQNRIDRISKIGHFDGNDYTFGFKSWKSGTLILLKRLFPTEEGIVKQIEEIKLKRVHHKGTETGTGPEEYNLQACKNEAKEILQILIDTITEEEEITSDDFWSFMHPKVKKMAKVAFDNKLYADSVSICLREINTIVKEHVRKITQQELDGAHLMTRAFSVNAPLIEFADISTESGRNIQQGYMKIFEGAMIGIRNPKAHANMYPDENKTIHFLFIASFLFIKLDEAGINLLPQ